MDHTIEAEAGFEAVSDQAEQSHLMRNLIACAAAGGLLLGACSGDSDPRPRGDRAPATTTTVESNEAKNCSVEKPDLDANYADFNIIKPEAFFPPLNDVNDNNKVLVTPEVASERLRTQISCDRRALANIAVILELREAKQLPDAGTINRVQKLIELYEGNDEAALAAVKSVHAALNKELLERTETFAVTDGQATEFQATRTKVGDVDKVSGEVAQTVKVGGNFRGFLLGYNRDNKELTEEQRALFDKLKMLVLIHEDGTIIVNMLLGDGGFKLDVEQPAEVPMGGQDSEGDDGDSDEGQGNRPNNNRTRVGGTSPVTAPNGPGGTNVTGPAPSGTTPVTAGPGGSGTVSNAPTGSGQPGGGPGVCGTPSGPTCPGTGPGGNGEGAPTPPPTEAPKPPVEEEKKPPTTTTTTTTRPPATTTTTTTTTTVPTKPDLVCDPEIDDC